MIQVKRSFCFYDLRMLLTTLSHTSLPLSRQIPPHLPQNFGVYGCLWTRWDFMKKIFTDANQKVGYVGRRVFAVMNNVKIFSKSQQYIKTYYANFFDGAATKDNLICGFSHMQSSYVCCKFLTIFCQERFYELQNLGKIKFVC